jgi:hypothetical protein
LCDRVRGHDAATVWLRRFLLCDKVADTLLSKPANREVPSDNCSEIIDNDRIGVRESW